MFPGCEDYVRHSGLGKHRFFFIFYGPHRKKRFHGLELGKFQTPIREDPDQTASSEALLVKAFTQTISV